MGVRLAVPALDGSLVLTRVGLRTAFFTLGLVASSWSLSNIRMLLDSAGLDQVSARVLQTEPFRMPVLKRYAASAETVGLDRVERPETLREIAIVNERILEQDILEGRRLVVDDQIVRTRAAIETALETVPTDAFLWMALYWVRIVQEGFTPKDLALLRMSYATGPNEGWVALKRNRFTFIVSSFLSADLEANAEAEFEALVASGFDQDSADIFVGAAWPRRDKLLTRLENLPTDVKQRFARRLYDLGYDVAVPGVARFGDRPWR